MSVKNGDVVTFGEIMLRISPADPGERVAQATGFRIEPGGSEANVAAALACLGHRTRFVTALPEGPLGEKTLRYLRARGVDTGFVTRSPGRMGLYWTETGAGPRAGEVFYDREGSSFAVSRGRGFDLKSGLAAARWFHTSGITCGISADCCAAAIGALRQASRRMPVSMDLNFRSKLWGWTGGSRERVHRAMWEACSHAALITGNETDLRDALGLGGPAHGACDYEEAASRCFRKLRKLRFVALSLRTALSATHNRWSGVLFVRSGTGVKRFDSAAYDIDCIVDRVGAGDCFTAGIIHGTLNTPSRPQQTVDFAAGLSALKHTTRGDASQCGARDVAALAGNPGGKIVR